LPAEGAVAAHFRSRRRSPHRLRLRVRAHNIVRERG